MNGIHFLALCAIGALVALTYRWEIVQPRRARERSAHQHDVYELVEEAPASRAARFPSAPAVDEQVFDMDRWPATDPSTKVHELALRTHELFEGRESA